MAVYRTAVHFIKLSTALQCIKLPTTLLAPSLARHLRFLYGCVSSLVNCTALCPSTLYYCTGALHCTVLSTLVYCTVWVTYIQCSCVPALVHCIKILITAPEPGSRFDCYGRFTAPLLLPCCTQGTASLPLRKWSLLHWCEASLYTAILVWSFPIHCHTGVKLPTTLSYVVEWLAWSLLGYASSGTYDWKHYEARNGRQSVCWKTKYYWGAASYLSKMDFYRSCRL